MNAQPLWPSPRSVAEHEQLQRAPALPVLAAVTSAVDIAIAVLRIQHPFLAGSTRFDHMSEPEPIMLAEIVRLHAIALRSAIEKYRHVVSPFPDLPDEDTDDF